MTLAVAVLDDYQNVAQRLGPWERLSDIANVTFFSERLTTADEVIAALTNFDVVVAMRERTPFPAPVLDGLPRMRLLVTTGMANAVIDFDVAARRGIVVCGTGSLGGTPTVELTWGLLLACARQICAENSQLHHGGWQHTVGLELSGRTLAVLGLGRLGSQVARIGQAFGMRVVAWSQNLERSTAEAIGVTAVSKEELFGGADFLTVHLKLSDRTRGLVGRPELALMKRHAYLVNTSRGPIVDEDALIHALIEERIGGAALDVYDAEPLPRDSVLRTLPNAVLTPHLGYVTEGNYARYYEDAVGGIEAFLRGQPVRVLQA